MAKNDISEDRLRAIKNEIKMSLILNQEDLQPIMDENLARYMGTFIPSIGSGWDINLNEVYPIIQNNQAWPSQIQ